MRLKYRRSSPGLFACLYVFILLGIGMLQHYNSVALSMPFGRQFLLAILGIQFALSGLISLIMVGSSMNAEVNNRTFDFQRIVSLSPREILIGKIIGEPVVGYFLAMATLPLVVVCWLLGGATLASIVLFYVNLVTFTLMCSSVGLLHTLAEPNQTPGKPRSGSIGGLAFLFIAFLPSMIIRGGTALSNPWVGTAVKLLTPVGSLVKLANGEPFAAQIEIWGLSLPSLLVAPLAQLAVAAWFVQVMARRLKNPVHTAFGRYDIYFVLAVVDFLVAGVCYSQWRIGWQAGQLVAQFCLAHIITCLFLLLGGTPSRAILMAWLWRKGGKQSWRRNSLLNSRAEITLALFGMWLLGEGILMVGFVLPAIVASMGKSLPFDGSILLEYLIVTGVLVVALGMICQWCQVFVGKAGNIVFVCIVLVLNIVPPILAGAVDVSNLGSSRGGSLDLIYSFSPVVFFLSRVGDSWGYPLPSLPLIIGYLFFAWITHSSFRAWRDQRAKTIAGKIKEMTSAP